MKYVEPLTLEDNTSYKVTVYKFNDKFDRLKGEPSVKTVYKDVIGLDEVTDDDYSNYIVLHFLNGVTITIKNGNCYETLYTIGKDYDKKNKKGSDVM